MDSQSYRINHTSNIIYVHATKHQEHTRSCLGIYSTYYHQYSKWHGPHTIRLEFDDEHVTGTGTDNIDSFTVQGVYSR